MIEFPCKSCGQKLSVKEEQSGRRIRCPKCGSVGVAPDSSDKIKFHCESCGQSISVLQIHAGKKGKCPKCKASIVVPSATIGPAGSAASGPSIPSGADQDQYEHKSDLPEEGEGMDPRLIVVICAAAAVVVVGLIILVAVILHSGSRPVKKSDTSQRETAADSASRPVASDSQLTGTSTPGLVKEDIVSKEPAKSSAAASEDAGKLDLKLRPKPGQKRHLRIITEDNTSHTTGGLQTDGNSITTIGLELEVKQVDANGLAHVKVTYLTIHEVLRTAQRHKEYDSTKPDTAGESLFSAMIGQSFVAKVTTEGQIIELDGLDEMHRRIAEAAVRKQEEVLRRKSEGIGLTLVPIEERIESKKKGIEMSTRIGKEGVREMLGNVIVPLPLRPVGIGDSWQARTSLSVARTGYDCTYTLRENKQDAVSVEVSSKIELDEDKPLDSEYPSAGRVRTTLSGSCQGSLEIDPQTGWMLHKKVTLRWSGEFKESPTQQRPQGSTTAMSMEIVTTVEPID